MTGVVFRSDVLAALVSAAYSGHDRAALFAVAITLQVEKDFIQQIERFPIIVEGKSKQLPPQEDIKL